MSHPGTKLRRLWIRVCLALLAALAPVAAVPALAQEPLGPEYLSNRACAVLVVRTGDIMAAPETELWPKEIIQAVCLQMLNLDSEHIAEIMLQIESPPSSGGPPNPEMALVVRLTEAYEIDEVLPMLQRGLEEGEINGSPALFSQRDGQPSLFMPDDSTLVVGGGPMLRRIGRQENPGTQLAAMLGDAGTEDDALLLVDLVALRPMLEELVQEAPAEELPPPLAGLLEAPELLDGLQLTMNITGDYQCQLLLQATEEDAADQMSAKLADALEFAAAMMVADAQASAPADDPLAQAWVSYAERMAPKIVESLQPEVNGSQLTLDYRLGPLERLSIHYGMLAAVGYFTQEQMNRRQYEVPAEAYGDDFPDEFEGVPPEVFQEREVFPEDDGDLGEGEIEEDPIEVDIFEDEGNMEEAEDEFDFSP